VLPDYYSSVSPLLLFFTLHGKLLSEGPHKQQQLLQQSLCGLTFATKKKISRNKKHSLFPKERKNPRGEITQKQITVGKLQTQRGKASCQKKISGYLFLHTNKNILC
jgi:hypothetical protein